VGTAQGSTASALIYVTPTNTLSGTLNFACRNLPANADCTFSATPSTTEAAGSALTFTPIPGPATQQSLTVTLWTDINPANIPPNGALHYPQLFHRSAPALAALAGWPMLLGGFTAILGFSKRLRNSRLLTLLTVIALSGGSLVMSGCGGNGSVKSGGLTPVGRHLHCHAHRHRPQRSRPDHADHPHRGPGHRRPVLDAALPFARGGPESTAGTASLRSRFGLRTPPVALAPPLL